MKEEFNAKMADADFDMNPMQISVNPMQIRGDPMQNNEESNADADWVWPE